MDRNCRVFASAFSGLGIVLLLLGILSAPPDAFADDDTCQSCIDACMLMYGDLTYCQQHCTDAGCEPAKICEGDTKCNDQSCYYRIITMKCSAVGDLYPTVGGGFITEMCRNSQANCNNCTCQKIQKDTFDYYCSCR